MMVSVSLGRISIVCVKLTSNCGLASCSLCLPAGNEILGLGVLPKSSPSIVIFIQGRAATCRDPCPVPPLALAPAGFSLGESIAISLVRSGPTRGGLGAACSRGGLGRGAGRSVLSLGRSASAVRGGGGTT